VRPPEWLPDLELTNLAVEATVDLRFWREDTKPKSPDGELVYTDDSEGMVLSFEEIVQLKKFFSILYFT